MGCEGERTIVPARGWALGEWCEPRSYCCICDISLCHVAVGCTHHHRGATVLELLGFSAVAQAREALLLTAPAELCGGRVYGPSAAAERLGIPCSTLESKIRALRINKHRFRP
jgi:hypothetical protein